MHFLTLLLSLAVADARVTTFTFINPKPVCTIVDGKLILHRPWPFGSWEACSYAILSAAQQLDAKRDELKKQLDSCKK